MNIDDLTIKQARELSTLFTTESAGCCQHPYEIGKNYLIRTVTHIYTGTLKAVGSQELVLTDAAWIADTGRFANACKDFSLLEEVEPFPDGELIVGRGAIIDCFATQNTVPRTQK